MVPTLGDRRNVVSSGGGILAVLLNWRENAMARYPGTEGERRIADGLLAEQTAAIFVACGMSEHDAALLAASLVQADLRGIHSHGVLRVPDYVRKLTRDGVNPRGRPRIIRQAGSAIVVDGDNSMGQIGGAFAMRQAIECARTSGVAAAAVGGSNHAGTMDFYVRMAIDQDMIGFATTNALPTMAPWGGTDKIIGLNPIGIGIPSGGEGPVVLDIALGATAHGKIRVHQQKGQPIPGDWAFDREGRPTTDPAAALEGLIQPIGAFKGLGLAVCMGILSSLLSGAGYGTESGNMVDGAIAGADGQFYLAINVAFFEDVGRFKSRMDLVVKQILTSRRAEGIEALFAPGGLEARTAASYRDAGIPLNDTTLHDLRAAALQLGVPDLLRGAGRPPATPR